MTHSVPTRRSSDLVSELGPGDAVFIPSMWWHHMEALEAFNVLVNYWWRQSPAWMDTPMNALMPAFMTVRDLPPAQREIWQEVFRHYVFELGEATAGHIPQAGRRLLSTLCQSQARELRESMLSRARTTGWGGMIEAVCGYHCSRVLVRQKKDTYDK